MKSLNDENKRVVTYEEFGAVGDGVTDDFAAMLATHEYANENGLSVMATKGKSYYIGNKTEGKSIPVKTNVNWNGATLVFDDSKILTHKRCGCIDCKMRSAPVFTVVSSLPAVSVLDAVKANLPINSSFDGVGTRKFENWPLDYDAIVHIGSAERKVFIRMGANADNGDNINEILLVHKDGTIDDSTPVTWNYTDMTFADAYSAEDEPIVIDGGGAIIKTVANRPENNDYLQYARNISVRRSNVKVCNFRHVVDEEQEFRAPYAGIIFTAKCNNVTYENIVLQAARRKFVASNNQQGTYEIGGYAANDIKFFNVNAKNFFAAGDAHDYYKYGVLHKAGELGNRGMMGSNYCRNFYFKNCRLVNFDAHKGLGNLTIEDCELQNILIMGAGNVLIKNTVKYVGRARSVVSYRGDYGASFRGNITIENVEARCYADALAESADGKVCILNTYYYPSNDYDTVLNKETGEYEAGEGSTNYMLTNLKVKNLTLTKYEVANYIPENKDGYNDAEKRFIPFDEELYIFSKGVNDGYPNSDISKFKSEGGYSDLNRYIPPKTVVIEDSYKNIVLPNSPTFKNTEFIIDGEKIEH